MKTNNDVNADGLMIYQSPWKNLLLILGALLFAVVGYWMLQRDDCDAMERIVSWVGIIFGGAGAIFIAITTIHLVIRKIPFLIIYDDRLEFYVAARRKYEIIYFADVKGYRVMGDSMVLVDLKPSAMECDYQSASMFKRGVMNFSKSAAGTYYGIPTSGLTMKTRELYSLLTTLLEKYRAQPGNPA